MTLITAGQGIIKDLEKHGALGVYVPLEGGMEGRYLRRIRAKGYEDLTISARGLGDLSMYLTGIHGVRPPHLGKKNVGKNACVGDIYYIPPIVNYRIENLPTKAKGLVLWVIEGHILSQQEIEYLTVLPTLTPKLKVIVELGGDRLFRWTPLKQALMIA